MRASPRVDAVRAGAVGHRRSRRRAAAGDAGRDPDAVVCRAGQLAAPGTSATSARIEATRSTWPTAYCGSAPPQRCTCASTMRGSWWPSASPTSATAIGRPARRRRVCRSAVSPCRPTEARRNDEVAGSSAVQAHFVDEKVLALMVRPSTGGTRKPDPGRCRADLRRPRASRQRWMPSRRPPARPQRPGRAAQQAGGRAAGRHTMTASARPPAGRRPSRRPGASRGRCVRARGRRPRCAVVDAAPAPPRRRDELGQRPTPPRNPAKAGLGSGAAADPAARYRTRGLDEALAAGRARQSAGTGAQRQPGGVPGVDPAEQRLDEPVDDGGAEPRADVVGDRHVTREHPTGPRLFVPQPLDLVVGEDAARRLRVTGMPIRVARGSGRSAPRDQTLAEVVAGVTTSSPPPTRWASARRPPGAPPAPTRRRRRRGARPPPRGGACRPAGRCLEHRDGRRGSASSTPSAAVSPAMPPPTTTTRGRVVTAGTDMSSSLSRGSGAPERAPVAPVRRRRPRGRVGTRDRIETRRREPTRRAGRHSRSTHDEGVIMRTPARPARRLTSAAAALAIGTGLVALAGCSAGSPTTPAPPTARPSAPGRNRRPASSPKGGTWR